MARKKELVQVMGRRWDTSRPNFFSAPAGLSLEAIVLQSLAKAYEDKVYTKAQYRVLLKYARCRLNGVEIARENWKRVFPEKGDRIEVLHGVRGGGGGGGKNPLGTILSVIIVALAAVATAWAGGTGIFAAGGILQGMGLGLTGGALFAAQIGIGIATIGMLYAVNMLFPAKAPSLGGLGGTGDSAKESPTYSINGGKNAHNIGGFVPLVLGRHRHTPPLGAKSWTEWRGDNQYFNMLVVWGHPDMTVSDFMIGETALEKYSDVTHVFHQSCSGSGLKYFGKQYNESSVGAGLKCGEWNTRTLGEANELSIDITFPGGLTTINKKNGNKQSRVVDIEIQYKPTAGGSWQGFAVTREGSIKAKSLSYSQEELNGYVSVFYKDGKIRVVPRGQWVNGAIRVFPPQDDIHVFGHNYVVTDIAGGSLKVTVYHVSFMVGNGRTYNLGGWGGFYAWEYDRFDTRDPGVVEGGRGGYTGSSVYYIDNPITIGINASGDPVKGNGTRKLYPVKDAGISGGNVSWRKLDGGTWYMWNAGTTYWYADVSSGSYVVQSYGRASIKGAKQKQIVKNYTQRDLPLKSYDVRVKRITGDSNDSYIIDSCEWTTMRAIIDKPAFDTPVPICVSELHIRASEQLSGYVTEFSGMCHSKIPDWTPETKTKNEKGQVVTTPGHWNTWRETSNPASIMRYLLTSKHSLIKPFPVSRLDNAALVALWNWCSKNDYRFDFVADSEENLWSRLVGVLSPAMAGPTTDVDGLWGAIIDQPDKTIKQLFTPRNSWGMNIERGFARLPDALRVKFVDETDNYVQKEGFVYNDGYSKDGANGTQKANDVVEWSFEGVTNWDRMYKLARYHLAQMLHRQMTVTINTDWEWLAVHRGDLVGLASDVLMNTFGTARIQNIVCRTASAKIDESSDRLIPEDSSALIDSDVVEVYYGPGERIPADAEIIGVEIDDTVVFSAPKPARYGIAVRTSAGRVNILEIEPEYDAERSVLRFRNRSAAAKTPPACGDLVSVSLLGEEYEEYLVASITPGDNMSAQLTLVPYKTKEIMSAANAKIPAYEAPVILDVVRAGSIPTPQLRTLVSDERVASITASGAVQINIGGTWSVPASADAPAFYTVEMRAVSKADAGTVLTGTASCTDEYVTVSNVQRGSVWYCKVRVHDPVSGLTSQWSNQIEHTVTGLVAPPPRPENVKAVPDYPNGIKIFWDEVNVIDLRRYRITGSVTAVTKGKETEYNYEPREVSGLQTYNVWSEDTTGNLSTTAGVATLDIKAPLKPVWRPLDGEGGETGARLENDGIVLNYENCLGTWPIVRYEGECMDRKGTSDTLRCVVPYPNNFHDGENARVRAQDYYLNWGPWSDPARVGVVLPKTPDVEIGVNANGTASFVWNDCRKFVDIKHYVLEGASAGTTSGLSMVLNVKSIKWEIFDLYQQGGVWKVNMGGTICNAVVDDASHTVTVNGTVYNLDENGDMKAFRIGAITEYVTAVDKYGFAGARGGKTFEIWPPYNPVISIERRTDGLYLTWQDCKRTFNVKHYVVKDLALNLTYIIDGTSQALKPRAAGYYSFSVQAIDCIDDFSSEMVLADYYLGGVGAVYPAARVDGADIVLEWAIPSSSWPIDYYTVYDQRQIAMGRCKTTYYRFPAPRAGSYEYGVIGKDVADNYGPMGTRASISISAPPAPVVTSKLDGAGLMLTWAEGTPDEGENVLPVVAWEIEHWFEYDDDGDGIASECNQSFGQLDATSTVIAADSNGVLVDSLRKVPALVTGRHWLYVRAIDSAGNVGEWGDGYIDIAPPGKVSFQNCAVVDNNVMLYWSEPDRVYFPIEYYLFEEVERYEEGGETVEYYAEIGRIDSLFAATFETKAGRYVYAITPVDAAGNRGERNSIVMQVSQPPDFILYHDYNSLFAGGNSEIGRSQPNGGKTNFVLDGEGHMIGPYDDQTWNENLAAIASEEGAVAETITWAQKAAWGYERWLDPSGTTAQYVEIIDVGALIPSTVIQVTIDSRTLKGEPVFSCKIETSQDAEEWITIAEDALMVHAGEFRYVRYTIGLSGGVVSIANINYKLDVKRKTDFGHIKSFATDNGEGYVDDQTTPMLKGTWVPFNVDFADVSSLPKPNVVNHPELVAYTVFEDVLYPQGFRLFVLDTNGNRVTAEVDWAAYGV